MEQKERCLGRGVKIHVSLNVNIISWKRNIKWQTFIFSYSSVKLGLLNLATAL